MKANANWASVIDLHRARLLLAGLPETLSPAEAAEEVRKIRREKLAPKTAPESGVRLCDVVSSAVRELEPILWAGGPLVADRRSSRSR
jgi:hypothetical protein